MKIRYVFFSMICAGMLSGCSDQLNYNEYNEFGRGDVVQSFAYVGGIMSTIYQDLDWDFGNERIFFTSSNGGLLASACDEAEYSTTGNSISTFTDGSWSPTNPQSTMWSRCYEGIAYCNLFLRDYVGLTFDDYKYNEDYKKQMYRYNNYQYEARFARAYFYFNLVRQYGAVPFTEDVLTTEQANSLERKPAQEVFDYIINECNEIQDKIIRDYSDIGDMSMGTAETGRASKLAVMALKARAALYAASPLFNTNNDASLWKRAAEANKAVLDEAQAEGRHLATDYASMFGPNTYKSDDAMSEIILLRQPTQTRNDFEKANFPVGVPNNRGGNGGNCPTQDLVDAYELTTTGEKYTGDYNSDSNPYANRDKRFAATIAVNGEKWPTVANVALQTYEGGANGQPLAGATPTGYYLKKYCNGSLDLRPNQNKKSYHAWVTYRLAEFYLNYAEAAFKVTGNAYQAPSGMSLTPAEAVDKIRERAGLPDLKAGLSAEEFWAKYTNERRVELAFEGHRFWDVRRWKEADKYFKTITEMHIAKDESTGKLTYTRKTIERQWDDKMYLFPIPQAELLKNKKLTQNPGWE